MRYIYTATAVITASLLSLFLPVAAKPLPEIIVTRSQIVVDIPKPITTTTTTQPQPVSKEIPADPSKRCPKYEQAFERYGLYPVDTFSYIAWRESRCRIKAINALWNSAGEMTWHLNKNGTYDSGLLQVNSGHRETVRRICRTDLSALMTVDCNLRVARYLLDNGGLRHWGL